MKYRSRLMKKAAIAVALALTAIAPTMTLAADDTIKIAYVDPLSGPFASSGDLYFKHFRYMAERINANGGILGKELVLVPFDNKANAQETLQILQEVADRGIHYIAQGVGSHVGGALVSGVAKHNRRHPDNPILYLNHGAVDPALTNEECSFWHFRFDAGSAMKLQAMTNYIATQPEIKKVFLINQDYSHGQFISRAAKEMLAEKRPDIEIVGDILHPVGRTKDFSPYVTEIAASGADAVITGNWGSDLTLLIKSASQAGLDAEWYTYYGGLEGAPTVLADAAAGNLKIVTEFQENLAARYDAPEMMQLLEDFEARYSPYEFNVLRIKTELRMLKKAMEKAGTTDPLKVAYALEGLSVETPFGTATMRAKDHQMLQPLFISTLAEDYRKYESKDTGLGWVMNARIPAEETAVPASCEMERPPRP